MNGRLIAEWRERPYTDHKRRRATVHHRVRLFVYDHGVDVEHQVRGDSNAPVPSEWTPANVWEVRGGRVEKLGKREVIRE